MSWVKIAHTRCNKPLFPLFVPHGSIWACDTCGKRWMLDRTPKEISPGGPLQAHVRWVDLAAVPPPPLSMQPRDVAARERRAARAHLDAHVDTIYADLGLERTR